MTMKSNWSNGLGTGFLIIFSICLMSHLQAQSCIRGNCINGFGTAVYASGDRYTGEFKHSRRHGKGILYASSGNKYMGDWIEDIQQGDGKMMFRNGDIYNGQFKSDQMSGTGTMDFKNGDKYTGQWLMNKPNGKGAYYFKRGERYEGYFVNARFEGEGILYYKSGSYYKGAWKASKKDGYGEFHDISGKIVAAHWKADKILRILDESPAKETERPKVIVDQSNSESPEKENLKIEQKHETEGNAVHQKPEEHLSEEDKYFKKLNNEKIEADTMTDQLVIESYFKEEPDSSVVQHEIKIEVPDSKEELSERPKFSSQAEDQSPMIEFGRTNEKFKKPEKNREEEKLNAEEKPVQNNRINAHKIEDHSPAEEKLRNCNTEYCEQGKGTFLYADGSRFIGEFQKGEPNGKGVCYYANGDRYDGMWKNHAPNGEGVMYFSSGLVYGAIWDHGKSVKELSRRKEFVFDRNVPVEYSKEVKIWAVIVGIARYEHMPALKYSDDDAYKIYAFLKSPEGGALKDEQIKILIDEDASRNSILQAMNQVFMRADENDVIMLYYSGHGLEGTFLPIDYDGYSNLLKHDEVKELLNKSKAKNKVCFIDACHSGSLFATKGSYSNSLIYFYDELEKSSGGMAFLMSSKSKEYSLEDGGLRQGIFSHYLIRGLKGEADTNRDLTISLKELFEYVYHNVRVYTGNIQTPMIAGEYDEEMPVGFIRND